MADLDRNYDNGLNFITIVSLTTFVRLVLAYYLVAVAPLIDMVLFTLYSQMSISLYSMGKNWNEYECNPKSFLSDWYDDVKGNLLPSGGVDIFIVWLLSMARMPILKSNLGLSVLGASSPVIADCLKSYVPTMIDYARDVCGTYFPGMSVAKK